MKRIQLIFLIVVCAVGFALAQTTQFTRTLKKADGTLLEGYTSYIWLVPQASTYPTGALPLTEKTGSPGSYYRDNVPYGVYKLYIDMDKSGAGAPVLKYENLPVVDNRIFSIADKFNSSSQLGTDGIQDNAVTSVKILNGSVTNDKLGANSVTETKILDGTITLNDISTAFRNYIDNIVGGGTINNQPDDLTLENVAVDEIGIKQTWVDANLIRLGGYSNVTGQKNFLGTTSLKWGGDSTWRANKDSLVIYGVNKGIRYRYADSDTLSYWTGIHRTEYSGVYDYIHFLSDYNMTPSGSRINTRDASYGLFFESNYFNGVDSVVEFNLESTLVNGVVIRPYQVQWGRNYLNRIYHLFTGRVQYQPITTDSVVVVIQDYGYANRTRFRIHNVDQGGYYDFHFKRNELQSDLVIAFNGVTPIAQFNNLKSKFNENLYVTHSDWDMTTNADSAFWRKVTSPGYGVDQVKHYYMITDDWNISDASFNPKLIFQFSSGALTLGAVGTVGATDVYLRNVYSTSTKVLGARDTGWTAFSGTTDESTAWATSTVTLEQLAQRVAALQVAFTTHGLIGP